MSIEGEPRKDWWTAVTGAASVAGLLAALYVFAAQQQFYAAGAFLTVGLALALIVGYRMRGHGSDSGAPDASDRRTRREEGVLEIVGTGYRKKRVTFRQPFPKAPHINCKRDGVSSGVTELDWSATSGRYFYISVETLSSPTCIHWEAEGQLEQPEHPIDSPIGRPATLVIGGLRGSWRYLATAAFVVAGSVLVWIATRPMGVTPPKRAKAMLIWLDTSGSVTSQLDSSIASVVSIVAGMPVNTEYSVFAVSSTAIPAQLLAKGSIRLEDSRPLNSPTQDPSRLEARRASDVLRSRTAPMNDRQQTCLLGSLRDARVFFQDYPPDKYDREVVFLSDMIDACMDVPTRGPTAMSTSAGMSLTALDHLPAADLPDVRVTVIFVRNESFRSVSIQEVEAFWRTAFNRARIGTQSADLVSFHYDVPRRLTR